MRLVVFFMLMACCMPAAAQQVAFTSSNLPVVVIDTEGQSIPNEPKIMARMGVVDNGPGQRNRPTDPFNAYDGWIGIETRGFSSQMFPKKQFAVETREADGTNRSVALLGLPEENDWVLYAPYSDKSLLRNVLAYHLANRMGHYASRTRLCELVLNGDYRGVYVLMEKIKRDKARVDIATLNPDETTGDDLTGGYIVKVDKWDGSGNEGWASPHPTAVAGRWVSYQYHDPAPDELVPEQKAYIRDWIAHFEEVMAGADFADPVRGYAPLLDVPSFVDYLLLNEVSRNVDGYRLSAFMYKDKDSNDGRLVMGPAWDYNLAFGNANYYDGSATTGFQVDFAVAGDEFQIPFWWNRLRRDTAFTRAVVARWGELRRDVLHLDTLHAYIDAQVALLDEAQARNFRRWPILSEHVWPNNYVGGSYANEVAYLKRWVRDRVAWLDAHIGRLALAGLEDGRPPSGAGPLLAAPVPNPFTESAEVTLTLARDRHVQVDLYDATGRQVQHLYDGVVTAGRPHAFTLEAAGLPGGTYFIHVRGDGLALTRSIVLVR